MKKENYRDTNNCSCKQLDELEQKYTKLKQIHNRVNTTKDYYESILQESTDIIFTLDENRFILKFNKGAESNLGYSQMEILGKPFKKLLTNETDEQKICDAVLQNGKISNTEVVMTTSKGEMLFANVSVSRMTKAVGGDKEKGMVVICKNITDKKKLETELIKKNKQLEELAITDNLTGLFNSRYFGEILKTELNRLKRRKNDVLSLLMIDVNSFKKYNDTFGHQEGDKVLRSIGEVIMSTIRKDVDTGYRYGGDEFVVILPSTDKSRASIVVERLIKSYNSLKYEPTGLAIGIADTTETTDEKELLKIADKDMYKHKKKRR